MRGLGIVDCQNYNVGRDQNPEKREFGWSFLIYMTYV
jgi:hypothetical protein